MEITFNNLPEAVAVLLAKIEDMRDEIKRLSQPVQEKDEFMRVDKAAEMLGVTSTAIRQNKKIPSYSRMNKLYYKKSELQAWLEAGKVKPKADKVFIGRGKK